VLSKSTELNTATHSNWQVSSTEEVVRITLFHSYW